MYLTENKQMVAEGFFDQMNLFGTNFGTPQIKGFPGFEEGKKRDACDLGVVVILFFPALEGYKL